MNPQEPQLSRLQIVKQEGIKASIGADRIQRTRLVVSIDKLVEDPENERKTFRNMDEMVASVKAMGIIEPLTVIALADDRFQIVTGHRRYRAAKLAGLEQIEVMIRPAEEGHVHRIKSLISNIQRENVPPMELAVSVQSLLTKEGLSQDQIAERLGKPKTWVSAVLRILDLPDEAKEKVGSSQLPLSIDALTRIARIEDPAAQVRLVEGLIGGMGNEAIREQIKIIKGVGDTKKIGESKPKEVFSTQQKATVIVQATTSKLTRIQVVEALKEALEQAKGT